MKKKTVSIVVWIVSAVVALTAGILALTEECAHVWNDWEVVTEQTCTQEGERVHRCTRCNQVETEKLPKKAHVQGKVETTKERTCMQDGVKTTYCKVCNNVMDTEKLPKLEHDWNAVAAKEATCVSVGYTAHEVCGYGCGTKRGYVESPKLEHVWEHVDALAATCTSTGHTAHETCAYGCGTKRGFELIPMHMSTTKVIPAVAHTCEEPGSTEGLQCTECEIWLTRPQIIPASHTVDPDAWNVTKKATCQSFGLREQVCSVCNITVEESIPMTGHTYLLETAFKPAKQPTCTSAGWTAHKVCDYCGAQDSSYKELALLPHEFAKTGDNIGVCEICNKNIFEYELRGDAYWLIDVNKKVITKANDLYDLTVPMIYEGKNVVGIAYKAAANCTFIRSINLPETIVTIEAEAFEDCSNLKAINLEKVKSIGRSAFEDCTALAGSKMDNGVVTAPIVLPTSLEEIGEYAFYGCDSLTELTVPFLGTAFEKGNTFGEIFGGNRYTPESLKKVTVLTLYDNEIPANAFSEMFAVQTIVLPEGVTKVGVSAFEGCSSLSTVLIGANDSNDFAGITSIGKDAFKGSKILTITLPFLGESKNATEDTTIFYAFGDKAEDIIVNKVTILNATEIAEGAFEGCKSLTHIVLPETITKIGSLAFAGTSLAEITLPFIGDGVDATNIGAIFGNKNAGNDCLPETLKKVEILKGSQTTVSANAFKDCAYLEEVVLPENITEIGAHAFEGCENLKEIVLPLDLVSIGTRSFKDTKLTQVVLPSTVEAIGESVFEGCNDLISLTVPFLGAVVNDTADNTKVGYLFSESNDNEWIPSTLKELTVLRGKTVAEEAFAGCSNLVNITISEETEVIEKFAFKDCLALTEFVVPENVKYVKSFAFSGCTGLTKLTLPFVGMTELEKDDQGNKVVIGQKHFGYIFDGDSTTADQNASIPVSLKTVVLTRATKLVNQAFYGCTSLESVILPSTLTSLGEEVFKGCTALKTAEFQKVENVDWTLTTISMGAFALCSSLEGVVLPASVEEIGDTAFGLPTAEAGQGCMNLAYIYTEDGDEDPANNVLKVKKIGHEAFRYAFVEGFTLKVDGLEDMADGTFGYSNLKSIQISGTLTEILPFAFYDCKYLETVVLPTSVTKLDANAFRNNPKMNKIVSDVADLQNENVSFKLPNLSWIGSYAFRDCIALTGKIEFTTAIWIDSCVFENCTGLTEVVFNTQTGKTYVGQNAFNGCTGLTEVVFNSQTGKAYIGQNAFNGCTNLEWVYLNYKNENVDIGGGVVDLVESGVVSIGNYAFKNCGTTLNDRNGEKQFLKVYVTFASDALGQTEPNWSEYWLMGAKVGDGNSYVKVADYAEYENIRDYLQTIV